LIIRDADIEFHFFSARSSFFAESLAGSVLSVMAAGNFVIADIRGAPLGAFLCNILNILHNIAFILCSIM